MAGGQRSVPDATDPADETRPRERDLAPDTDRTGGASLEDRVPADPRQPGTRVSDPPPTDPAPSEPDSDQTLKPHVLSPVEARIEARGEARDAAAARRESAVRLAAATAALPALDVTLRPQRSPAFPPPPAPFEPHPASLDFETRIQPPLEPTRNAVIEPTTRVPSAPNQLAAEPLNKSTTLKLGDGIRAVAIAASDPGYSSKPRLLGRPATDLIDNDDSDEIRPLDGAKLFADVGNQRVVGGTQLMQIIQTPAAPRSSLPADVSVYIREDSIDALESRSRSSGTNAAPVPSPLVTSSAAPRDKSYLGLWLFVLALALLVASGLVYVYALRS